MARTAVWKRIDSDRWVYQGWRTEDSRTGGDYPETFGSIDAYGAGSFMATDQHGFQEDFSTLSQAKAFVQSAVYRQGWQQ